MADYKEKIDATLSQIYWGELSNPKEAINEAVRLADAHQDILLGIETRQQQIYYDQSKALVAISWVWAQLEKNPELEKQVDLSGLLYEYSYTIEFCSSYPQLSRDQLWNLADDFASRMERYGYYQTFVYDLKFDLAREFKDFPLANTYYIEWKRLFDLGKIDLHSNPKWEIYRESRLYAELFQDVEKALEVGKPILEKEISDPYLIAALPSNLILPLFHAGKLKLADEFQRRSEGEMIQRRWLEDMGWHLTFLSLTDQLKKAKHLFTQHMARLISYEDLFTNHHYFELKMKYAEVASVRFPQKWDYLLGARLLFRKLQLAGETSLVFDFYEQESKEYRVDELAELFEERLIAYADLFDRRNGNSWYRDEIEKYEQLIDKKYRLI